MAYIMISFGINKEYCTATRSQYNFTPPSNYFIKKIISFYNI